MPAFWTPISVLQAVFHTSVAKLADLPRHSQAEVAFVGRSNAGKSSAINVLANRRRLAYVSKTPGRTQLLNYFQVAEGRFLVDLPGYGYARAPLAQQQVWQALVGAYLLKQSALCGLVVIMDVRHPLTELDVQLLQWWRPTGKPVHILLSKADKLSRGQAMAALHQVDAFLVAHGVQGSAQLFSATKRQGLDEAEGVLRAWLQLPPVKSRTAGAAAPAEEGGAERAAAKKNPAQGEEAGSNEP